MKAFIILNTRIPKAPRGYGLSSNSVSERGVIPHDVKDSSWCQRHRTEADLEHLCPAEVNMLSVMVSGDMHRIPTSDLNSKSCGTTCTTMRGKAHCHSEVQHSRERRKRWNSTQLAYYLLIVLSFLKSTPSQIAETALLGQKKHHTFIRAM